VADITESRALLLGSDPETASLRAAKVILAAATRRRSWIRWRRLLLPALFVPAIAAAALAIMPKLATAPLTYSVKGQLIIEAFCKRGEAVFPVVDRGEFLEGDRLRFAYSKDSPGRLVVFSVDDQGIISPYYQETGLTPMFIQAGVKVMLPGSIELDNHKGWERVFALWSAEPMEDETIRTAVATAFSAANGDLQRMSNLDLPTEQVSFLLRRP
jgi:hypothetical protein